LLRRAVMVFTCVDESAESLGVALREDTVSEN
jgi:hypothetical protein